MARDDKITMRDTLVIAGGLIAFYSALAMLYTETLRSRSDFCSDASFILINGVCYTVWKMLLPVFLLGVILLVVGLVVFRGEPEELESYLHHGSGAHFTLALLISLVAVPFLLWIIQTVRQSDGDAFVVEFGGTQFEHTFLLELAILVGLVALVPFLGLYITFHMRRRRFMDAVAEATEEGEEAPLPHEGGYTFDDAAPAEEEMPEDEWPEDRDGWEPEEPATPDAPAEEPMPPAAPVEPPASTPAPEPATSKPPEPTPPEPRPEAEAPDQPEEEASWAAAGGSPVGGETKETAGWDDDEEASWADESSVVSCLHKDDGTSCSNPVRPGSRYCEDHACQATTKAGKACSNPAMDGMETCRVHA